MKKVWLIIFMIFIALLGVGFEVLNYYIFALNDKLHKIGVAMAGGYIGFISILGNIMFYYHYSERKKKK